MIAADVREAFVARYGEAAASVLETHARIRAGYRPPAPPVCPAADHEEMKRSHWQRLSFIGYQPAGADDGSDGWIVLTNCMCGTTLAREVPAEDAPLAAFWWSAYIAGREAARYEMRLPIARSAA